MMLRQLRDFFAARGHATTVIVGMDDAQPVLSGYQVAPGTATKGWRTRLAEYKACVMGTRPDVVYALSGREEMDLLRFLECARVRHCFSLEQQQRVDMFYWLRQMAGLLEGISANTPDVLEEVARRGLMSGKALLGPYAINSLFFSLPDTAPPADSTRPLEVCFAARFEAFQKRAHWLPEIDRRCRAAGRKFSWHLYGQGELETQLRAAMPADSTVFHGWVDNAQMAARLPAHDLFFLCSLWEGLPIAMVEAMLCGLAVVAPAIPAGITFVLQKGGGWTYAASSPRAAAEALLQGTADLEALRQKRRQAQRIARELFRPALVEEQMLQLEAQLLDLRCNGRRLDLTRAPKFHAVPLRTFLRRKVGALMGSGRPGKRPGP